MLCFSIGIILLIPTLFPVIVGMLLSLGIRKVRSDLLALFAGLFMLLLQSIIMKQLGFHDELSLYESQQTLPTTIILLLRFLSSISISLIFPFIFARWGVELVDRIRVKDSSITRHNSKGNFVLGIMIAISITASFAQTIPMITGAFYLARQRTIINKDITKSLNATSNVAPSATSKAVQD